MEQLWTNIELGQYLNRSPRTINTDVAKRRIPFIRIGRLIRFRQSEIDAWLDRNRVPARQK
ncbi:MAG: helix-turn-helix domain-containing protein [Spirochaetes bacterium]|nr:helix-turn-helix domain-containing protein [Spirochaetota bacterium]